MQQQIDKILRKVAHQFVLEKEKTESTKSQKKKKTRGKKKSNIAEEESTEQALSADGTKNIKLERDDQGAILITPESLGQFLGKPPFSSDRYHQASHLEMNYSLTFF